MSHPGAHWNSNQLSKVNKKKSALNYSTVVIVAAAVVVTIISIIKNGFGFMQHWTVQNRICLFEIGQKGINSLSLFMSTNMVQVWWHKQWTRVENI